MGYLLNDELFPSRLSVFIFVGYIILFVSQGILVTASQGIDNDYDYSTVTVVLFTEVLKLIISIILFLGSKRKSTNSLIAEILEHRRVLYLYFIPAFLYAVYNNLAFTNLSKFDPTTYYLLLQFRVVVTGILFQIIFSKTLSTKQWISLVVLTCGCMLKQFNFNSTDNLTFSNKSMSIDFGLNTAFLFIQIICSCLAGVYNEYLLKKPGANINIYVQNVFMYLDSIVCNIVLLLCLGDYLNAFTYGSMAKIFHFKVVIVMINNALIGIVTSFFLKTLNSILKTFASALELILTAVLSFILLGIPIYLNTSLAILTVLYAVFLYSRNPVSNVPKSSLNDDEKEALVEV